MPHELPKALAQLADAPTEADHARAWEGFLSEYSALILHVIRRMGGDHDAVMDRYAFTLDALSRDRSRRLRAFVTTGRGKFTTWLVAVVRRLCVDEHRARYGRPQSEAGVAWVAERRNLADLISDELALDLLEAPKSAPDSALLQEEVYSALQRALAKLAPDERLVLRLRFEDDVTVPEIARLLGYSSPFRLYREIDKLLDGLRRELQAVGHRGVAS